MMIRLIPVLKLLGAALLIVGLASCCRAPPPEPLPPTAIPVAAPKPTLCALPVVVAPTPSANPGYTQLDPTTGLHVTGQAQTIDLASYRLKISGRVNSPLELTYDELRCLPKLDCDCTIICPGFFADRADWAGASLAGVLKLADVQRDAKSVELIGADGYSSSVTTGRGAGRRQFPGVRVGREAGARLARLPGARGLPQALGRQLGQVGDRNSGQVSGRSSADGIVPAQVRKAASAARS